MLYDEEIKFHFSVKRSDNDLRDLKKFFKVLTPSKIYSTNKNTSGNNSIHFSKFFEPQSQNFLTSKRQQVTVKFRYSDKMESHKKFLNVYMVQKNKDEVEVKPELFGNISQEEYKSKMTDKAFTTRSGKTIHKSQHYKWILSPEKNLTEEELKTYTKLFIKELEIRTGHKYDWQAVVHTDTPHNHVHVLINGLDQAGKSFRFSKNVVQKVARDISQDILTRLHGERSNDLIQAAKEKSMQARRWTNYDEKIFEKIEESDKTNYLGKITMSKDSINPLRNRLDALYSMELVDYINGSYYIKNELKDTLKANGRYNQFLDLKNTYKKEGVKLKLYTPELGKITGKIVKLYSMNDEDVWNNACVILNEKNNIAYYVPTFKEQNAKLLNKNVNMSVKENQKGQLSPDFEIEI